MPKYSEIIEQGGIDRRRFTLTRFFGQLSRTEYRLKIDMLRETDSKYVTEGLMFMSEDDLKSLLSKAIELVEFKESTIIKDLDLQITEDMFTEE
jgi:hypothetical protein